MPLLHLVQQPSPGKHLAPQTDEPGPQLNRLMLRSSLATKAIRVGMTLIFFVSAGLAYSTKTFTKNVSGVNIEVFSHRYLSPFEDERLLVEIQNVRGRSAEVLLRLVQDGSRGAILSTPANSNVVLNAVLQNLESSRCSVDLQIKMRKSDLVHLLLGRMPVAGIAWQGAVRENSTTHAAPIEHHARRLATLPISISPIPFAHKVAKYVGGVLLVSVLLSLASDTSPGGPREHLLRLIEVFKG